VKRESLAYPVATIGIGAGLAVLLGFSLGAPQRLISLVAPRHVVHRLDGRVEGGEYQFQWSDAASQLRFAWSIEGDRLVGAVSTPDTGWVAVGFGGGGPLMNGADIVIGYVDARGARVRDHFASSPTGQEADTALGGRDDILASAGLQTAQGTTIEFERPLAAHDSADQPIEAGQTHVIVASSSVDDFTAYHAGGAKAVALLDLFAGPPAATATGSFLPDHLTDVQIMLATWMALFFIVGVHGLAVHSAAAPEGTPGGAGAGADAAVALIGVCVLLELGSLGGFAVGVALAAPTWLLGSTLALGLLALAGIIVLYSRAFVPWEVVRAERDDGIPW